MTRKGSIGCNWNAIGMQFSDSESVSTMQRTPALLLFGGTGAIGRAIARAFDAWNWRVVAVSRRAGAGHLAWDPLEPADQAGGEAAAAQGPFDAVCWAQGMNANDSVYDVDLALHERMYRANCAFVLASLRFLLDRGLLSKPSRLCVISSIWQDMARQDKLSYSMTKAALRGLVLSAANDLGRDGHLINAVLPGVLETPMTRANLSHVQIDKVTSGTQFGRLAELDDVARTVRFLCSPENTGVTGQFIKVDLGFSDVRIL